MSTRKPPETNKPKFQAAPQTAPFTSTSGLTREEKSESVPVTPYEVGYKKPPVATRFRPGRSGNPQGRRKKVAAPEELLAKIMGRKITVIENGVTRKITRIEALIHQTFKDALKGNTRAADSILKMARQYAIDTATIPEPADLSCLTMEELDCLHKIKIKIEKREYFKENAHLKKKHGLCDEDLLDP